MKLGKLSSFLIITPAFIFTSSALASNQESQIRYGLSIGTDTDFLFFDVGSDAFATENSNSMDAGTNADQGLELGLHALYPLNKDWHAKLAISRVSESTDFTDRVSPYYPYKSEYTRFPIDLIFIKQLDKRYQFGLGITYHLNPSYEAKYTGVNQGITATANFDNAIGFIAALDYNFSSHIQFGVQYTSITYSGNLIYKNSDGSDLSSLNEKWEKDASRLAIKASLTF